MLVQPLKRLATTNI